MEDIVQLTAAKDVRIQQLKSNATSIDDVSPLELVISFQNISSSASDIVGTLELNLPQLLEEKSIIVSSNEISIRVVDAVRGEESVRQTLRTSQDRSYIVAQLRLKNIKAQNVSAAMIWQIQAGIASLLSTSVTLVHVVSAQDMKTDYLRMEKTAVELVIELSAAVDNTRRHYHDVLTFGRAAEGVDERTTLPHVWETFLMKDSHYYFDSIRVELYPDDQEAPQEFQTLLDGATIAETRTAKLFYLNQSFADASFVYQGCPETSPFCLHLVWNTRDGSDYWLEKLEMHPHLVSSHFETRLDLVSPSPMIHQGNSTVWTLYGADEANDTGKLWFQLNLRERYTEARQVVDVRANQLNPQQMRATVTLMSMNGTKTLSFESRILNGKEFSLYIDIDKDNNTAPLAYGSCDCVRRPTHVMLPKRALTIEFHRALNNTLLSMVRWVIC